MFDIGRPIFDVGPPRRRTAYRIYSNRRAGPSIFRSFQNLTFLLILPIEMRFSRVLR
jgi:hypothetical protein